MAKKRRKKQEHQTVIQTVLALVMLVIIPFALIWLADGQEELPVINPYRAEDFVLKDGRMICLTTDGVPGIDVSYYQGDIDWEQVRQSGVEFAFVRLGYRRSVDGILGEDEMAAINLRGASEAGLKIGAYFFSQAISPEEAREEAKLALEILDGTKLDLPVAYDWETVDGNACTRGITGDVLMECVDAFCSAVEAKGYDSMVYFNRDLSQTLLDVRRLGKRSVWFAMYDTYPDAPCKPDYWQYTDKGTVPGIEGNVDLNLYLP